jgi:hypothetical protein
MQPSQTPGYNLRIIRSRQHHSAAGEHTSPTIDTACNISHDASMRTSSLLLDARAPIQYLDLVFTDHDGIRTKDATPGYILRTYP